MPRAKPPATERFAVALPGHDADRPIRFEDDQARVIDPLQAMLREGRSEIVLVEVLGRHVLVDPDPTAELTDSQTTPRPDTLLTEVIAMTMREALDKAMGRDSADGAMAALQEGGIAMANEDTMSQAIHDVYCGIMADHQHPNQKDRDQARQLIAALERQQSV